MSNNNLDAQLQQDLNAIKGIDAIPSILNVVCNTTGMGFSAIARVTDTQWITCASRDEIDFDLQPGDELVLETTLCNEIREGHDPIIIKEVDKDNIFKNHPTPERYGFQSYISFPIFRKNGDFFGTLCALDHKPVAVDNKEIKELFELCVQLITFHLDATEELSQLNTELKEEKHVGELRETFIAALGHDLRNPISTIRMCTDILAKLELGKMGRRQVKTIKSTSYRMQGLIDNLLDFAKGQLGDGIDMEFSGDLQLLKKSLQQVAREIRTVDSEHQIDLNFDLQEDFECDINRISQMYSNLLENAVKHGADDEPIVTEVSAKNGFFELKVSNHGDEIPSEKRKNLFKPFTTSNSTKNKSGLGLGLYITSEIAKAHNGKIEVSSKNRQTSFKFIMPIALAV